MRQCRDIATHLFQPNDLIFFDANVWLYIYGPQGGPNDAVSRTYSLALSKIIKAGCNLYIDVLVLSEFANRYARIEFETRNTSGLYSHYKDFRNSVDFVEVAQAVADSIRRILKISVPVESGLPNLDLATFTTRFENGSCDLNDMIIAALCTAENFILVTHDSDFDTESVSILTANKTLLHP